MLLSGLISILQIIFIPGFIITNLLKIKAGTAIEKWLYIFSFSLFLNYSLVTILVLFSIYSAIVMWGIVVFETAIIFFLYRIEISHIITGFNFRYSYIRFKEFVNLNSLTTRIIIIFSAIIVFFYISAFIANIGTIFYFIDTVNNYEWNRWAIDFANNIFPKYSSHFPQLIPANWSVCYVMIAKTDVHFFPKFFMPLFFINNLLILIDLAITEKNRGYLIGLIIYGLFAPIVYTLVFIVDGTADLPVSFFAFLSFYSLLKVLKSDFKLQGYLLTFLFAATAASTKLAGFYTFTIVSIVLGLLLIIKRDQIDIKKLFKIVPFALIVAFICLFWYFRSPEVMVSGLHQPEYLPRTNYFNIGFRAIELMYYMFGVPVFVFFIVTIFTSLFDKKSRYLTIIAVIIPIAIWMFKFSVDFRNLSFVIPFLSLCSAAGLLKILEILAANKNDFNLRNMLVFPDRLNENLSSYLEKKSRISLIYLLVTSIILFFVFISDAFNSFLLGIYTSIDKYYFQMHRMLCFIEYDFFLHVDFYQRVFTAAAILGIVIPIFILVKIRMKNILIILSSVIVLLNFTVIKEADILKRQEESFDRVDARNYYRWVKMYMDHSKLSGAVYTNFNAIANDKKLDEIEFRYTGNKLPVSPENMYSAKLFFLKMKLLEPEKREIIKSKISKSEYKLIFDDNDFIFYLAQP